MPGLIICGMSAYSVFLRSAKLWAMSRGLWHAEDGAGAASEGPAKGP